MVTYVCDEGGELVSRDFVTLAEAMAAAYQHSRALADGDESKTPVSVDDHEGNVWDAEVLKRLCWRM